MSSPRLVLVTGATAYVGGRLLPTRARRQLDLESPWPAGRGAEDAVPS